MSFEAGVVVRCAGCGVDFELSRRNAREHERLGVAHVCHDCRHPARPPDPRQVEAMQRWWLSRFTIDELQSWPPL